MKITSDLKFYCEVRKYFAKFNTPSKMLAYFISFRIFLTIRVIIMDEITYLSQFSDPDVLTNFNIMNNPIFISSDFVRTIPEISSLTMSKHSISYICLYLVVFERD